MNTYNILIAGTAHSGKSAYINRYMTGGFVSYNSSIHNSAYSSFILEHENKRHIVKMWESSEKILSKNDLEKYDGVILMFDMLDSSSYSEISEYCKNIHSVSIEMPVVIIGNKCDRIKPHYPEMLKKLYDDVNVPCHGISTKTGFGFEKPLLRLFSQ